MHWGMMALTIVVAITLAGAAFVITRSLSSDDNASVSIELVAADETGSYPFTADMTNLDPDDAAPIVDGKIELASESGSGTDSTDARPPSNDRAGLSVSPVSVTESTVYASRTESVCDGAKMAVALESDDEARASWADLMEVGEDDIAATIDSLTPLVLARDTAVTNSRYRDGRPEWFQAILQAGTPVLVDANGAPRVKCSCGNPLKAPDLIQGAQFHGERWDRFAPSEVISIEGAKYPVDTLSTVDLDTGKAVNTAIGPSTTTSLDGYLVDDATGVYVVDDSGAKTQVLDHPVARVVDDGLGGLVFQYERNSDEYLSYRRNTVNQPPADHRAAGIWWLKAGAEEPQPLLSSDDPTTHWYSLQDVGSFADEPQVVYLELRQPSTCVPDGGCHEFWSADARLINLGTKKTTDLDGLSGEDGEIRMGPGAIAMGWVADDHGALQWMTETGTTTDSVCDIGCAISFRDVVNRTSFVGLSNSSGYSLEICDFEASLDCKSAELSSTDAEAEQVGYVSVTGRDAVVSVVNANGSGEVTYLVDLDDMSVTTSDLRGRASRLTNPLLRPKAEDQVDPESTGLEVSDLVLRGDGLGPFRLGDDAEIAIAKLGQGLGLPGVDSGWGPGCELAGPGPEVRTVSWGALMVAFERPVGGPATLSGWSVRQDYRSGQPQASAFRTSAGIGVGSSLADASAAHSVEPITWDEVFSHYATSMEVDGGTLGMITNGDSSSATITHLDLNIGACE